MTWFCVQAKPNCAAIAVKNLTRQGFETFLPKERATTRHKTGFRTRVRPLFPGYVFVALDVERGGWRSVNSTYGVSRVVSFGDQPAAVPEDLIEGIRRLCEEEDVLRAADDLQPGNTIRITTGPFAEIVTEIMALAPEQRIWVLLDLMGAKTRVSLQARHVQKIEQSTNAVVRSASEVLAEVGSRK